MVVHGSPNPWCRVTEIARQSPAAWVQRVRFPSARALPIDENQRKRPRFLATSGKPQQGVALRARLLLLASEGVPNHAIAIRIAFPGIDAQEVGPLPLRGDVEGTR